MKALFLKPGAPDIELAEAPEPSLSRDDEIKLKIIRVGICGTDREEAGGGRALAPAGKDRLIIGHEMFGRVEQTGKSVARVRKGDYAVFTVRRGCGECLPCSMNRSDMCLTGKYRERGIWGMDGYQTEYAADIEQYVVKVPAEIRDLGVLAEPLSVAEKAIDECLRIAFARLPAAPATPDWFAGRHCLIAGLGPIGLLGAMALRLRGAEVFGMDIVDEGTPRPEWLKAIGGTYLDGRKVTADKVKSMAGPMDLLFDATGIPRLEFNLLDALGRNGIYVLTGIPGGDRPIQVPGADIIRNLVLNNQLMLGSVNACRGHFQMAVDDLVSARLIWGESVAKIITGRLPFNSFGDAFRKHATDEIKTVIEWSEDGH